MICLVDNKFKHVIYEEHINKLEELNEESTRCKASKDLVLKDSF